MGGTTSKPVEEAPANLFKADPNAATYSSTYVESELAKASAVARQIQEQAEAQASQLGSQVSGLSSWVWGLTSISSILFLAGVGLLIYYIMVRFKLAGLTTFFGLELEPGPPPASYDLGIHSAVYTNVATKATVDLTSAVQNLIQNSGINIQGSAIPGVPAGAVSTDTIVINYQYSNCTSQTGNYTVGDTIMISYDPTKCTVSSTGPPGQKATAPVSSSWFGSLFAGNGGSGTLISNMADATNSSVVKATSAPLSSGSSGAYGMQWWMFIKDWNYGYGKDKQVLSRADPTNTQVLNPSVALHPTDNTMRITVSVFPDESGSSSKTQPAPAGHSGSTDDVFVCEVPNLPLQDWFSVSMTVFGRNLDVYIDGKLVKSCLLPGVPKPASGDITLAGNGGFSGSLCNFNHYSRMLVPADASSFYSAGTSCKSSTGPSTASTATGYAVKFGVYDTVGKKVQEYTF